jgi:hypothetical protein
VVNEANTFESDVCIDDIQLLDLTALASLLQCPQVTIARQQQTLGLRLQYTLTFPATRSVVSYNGTEIVHDPQRPLILPVGDWSLVVASAFGTSNVSAGCPPIAVSILRVQQLPFAENFDVDPMQWSQDPFDSGDDFLISYSTPNGANFDHTSRDGRFAFVTSFENGFGDPTNLLSPRVDLSGATDPKLSFWMQNQVRVKGERKKERKRE